MDILCNPNLWSSKLSAILRKLGIPSQVDFTCVLLRALCTSRNSAQFRAIREQLLAIPRDGIPVGNPRRNWFDSLLIFKVSYI